ncbi:MAG: hypothetical protein AAB874_06500 [Patescibacteria group bacterium]
MENQSQLPVKRFSIATILGWMIGFVFIGKGMTSGFSTLVGNSDLGLFYATLITFAGIVIFPPFWNYIRSTWNIGLPKAIKILLFSLFFLISLVMERLALVDKDTQKLASSSQEVTKIATPTFQSSPIINPSLVNVPSTRPTTEPTQLPTPTPSRRIVKGSTPKGEQFYNRVEALHQQGSIYGDLYKEFESDDIVDINPEMQSVQIGLRYTTVTGRVEETDKVIIMSDFDTIKTLAEQDNSLIVPGYNTLRLFILTFHDNTGEARGEVEQMMIDDEPKWIDW